MKKILIVSNNSELILKVTKTCESYPNDFDCVICSETDSAISIIDYEIPEIKIIDFTSPKIDANKIVAGIRSDPWLHNGGIIAVVPGAKEVQELEDQKDSNILIVQTMYTFKENFERLIRVLLTNPQFLFNRGLQDTIGGEVKGLFVCDNNPFDIRLYTTFLVNYLYYSNRINEDNRFALQTALMELLTNALEHGNCNISYDEKSEFLATGGNILTLIQNKLKNPEIAGRKIRIHYSIGRDKSQFCIEDEGNGFDWKKRLAIPVEEMYSDETHGRGMTLTKTLVTDMKYNEKGNAVSFGIENLRYESNNIPGIMVPFDVIKYEPRQIVCRQNETSNDLFYIVSGRYGVYVNGKLISVLTPNDMFIGEMAFLLNDRRSATIMSAGNGKLIKIPKVTFMNLIRKNPHYAIFLSKLLAQRLNRTNQKLLEISNQNIDNKK